MNTIIDAHLDLAYNAVNLDRDITLTTTQIREKEAPHNLDYGQAMVTLPQLHQANASIFFGTLFARSQPYQNIPKRSDCDYPSPAQTHANASAQIAYYHALELQDKIKIIKTKNDLNTHWQKVQDALQKKQTPPLACIILMEGCDPIIHPSHLTHWTSQGLTIAALIHCHQNQYATGTGSEGPITPLGIQLLKQFEKHNIILDTSHLCDQSFDQALDIFQGPIIASHNNARKFLPGNRHLTDQQIKKLIKRNAVIGAVVYSRFILPNWTPQTHKKSTCTLQHLVDHIDHICQIAGNTKHIGIGSDLDGGYGAESAPHQIDTIADLPKIKETLANRGYTQQDIQNITYLNWLNKMKTALPD